MLIGILGGTGKEGAGLAQRWAMAGHQVIIGSRDAERARARAAELSAQADGASITGMSNLDAATAAPVVVLTLPAALGALTTAKDEKGETERALQRATEGRGAKRP